MEVYLPTRIWARSQEKSSLDHRKKAVSILATRMPPTRTARTIVVSADHHQHILYRCSQGRIILHRSPQHHGAILRQFPLYKGPPSADRRLDAIRLQLAVLRQCLAAEANLLSSLSSLPIFIQSVRNELLILVWTL